MTQALARVFLGDMYKYRVLSEAIAEEDTEKLKQRLQARYRKITDIWDKELNSEWILRHYLAVKMIMSASLMLSSMEYSKEKNVRIVEPYLRYYSLLTICRALLFTTPEVAWNKGEIMMMNHSKIISIACSTLGSINKDLGGKFKNYITKARDIRELFSYEFPATGIEDDVCSEGDDVVKMCTMIAEIAQFQSEQLEFCVSRISNESVFGINWDFFKQGYVYKGKTVMLKDSDDWYRLDYSRRKQLYPINLYFTLSEGMVEDFFEAWCYYDEDGNEDEENDVFDPDNNWRIIFDMP